MHEAVGVAREELADLLLLLGRVAVVGEPLLLQADRLGERVAAVEPGGLVGVGLVADLADQLDVGGVAGAGCSAAQPPSALDSSLQPVRATAASDRLSSATAERDLTIIVDPLL